MQTFVGTVKSFVPSKGWGFIECQETFDMHGKDMFVMKTSLPHGHAEKGDSVTFTVEEGKSGPEAKNVQMRGQGQIGLFANGHVKGEGNYAGVVKSFNPIKGWGIIECAETFAYYGKDMFVLRSSLPNGHIEPGTSVRFTIIEGLKGPEAGDVQPVQAARPTMLQQRRPASALGARPSSVKSEPGMRAAPRPAAWAPQLAPAWGAVPFGGAQASDSRVLQSHHAGEVKSFNAEKGWGFITCTSHDFGKDVFVMRTALPPEGVNPGSKVQFKVKMGQKGYEADEVRAVPDAEALSGQTYQGTIKSYNDVKGWGFIASEMAQQMFGRDIFFHKRDLGEHAPTPGEAVEFTVSSNQKGHPQAVDLAFGGGFKAAPRVGGKGRAKPF